MIMSRRVKLVEQVAWHWWVIQLVRQSFPYWLVCYKVNHSAKQTDHIDSSSESCVNKMRFALGDGHRITNMINETSESKLRLNTICYVAKRSQ
jgi:hypothetical protein